MQRATLMSSGLPLAGYFRGCLYLNFLLIHSEGCGTTVASRSIARRKEPTMFYPVPRSDRWDPQVAAGVIGFLVLCVTVVWFAR